VIIQIPGAGNLNGLHTRERVYTNTTQPLHTMSSFETKIRNIFIKIYKQMLKMLTVDNNCIYRG
jgi:hypothetical protein